LFDQILLVHSTERKRATSGRKKANRASVVTGSLARGGYVQSNRTRKDGNNMSNRDFSLRLLVDQSPEEVFAAVTNVRGWWSQGLEGDSAQVGDEFTYRHEDVHRSSHRLTEVIPGKRVVWRTLDADLSFAKNRAEWTGTDIRFEIERKGAQTELLFTHAGLVPDLDCFESCSGGWSFYVGDSLRRLITTGQGKPDPRSNPETKKVRYGS
jgi:uncharacterized protein YndB with AHSA1/START domain